MAYTDDWESIMNGVFGAGGKPRFGGSAQPETKPPKSREPGLPDLNAALLENQKQLDALGQDAFVDSVVRAMRRPFVLGTEHPAARSVILICGGAGTGRHFALEETARIMAARGLLQNDKTAVVDLALYPDPGAEKLFLQAP